MTVPRITFDALSGIWTVHVDYDFVGPHAEAEARLFAANPPKARLTLVERAVPGDADYLPGRALT